MKKALSLLIIMSASLSTSYAHNAMDDLKEYKTYLEQALVLKDQPNIEAYATALIDLIWKAQVAAPQGAQEYKTQRLDKQIEAVNYGFRKKVASSDEDAQIRRAISTLVIVRNLEQINNPNSSLVNLFTQTFETEASKETPHQRAVKKHYQYLLKGMANEKAPIRLALQDLVAAAGTPANTLSYDESTYKGKVYVTNTTPLAILLPQDFIPYTWVKAFYVRSERDQKTLQDIGIGIPVEVIKQKVETPPAKPEIPQAPAPSPMAATDERDIKVEGSEKPETQQATQVPMPNTMTPKDVAAYLKAHTKVTSGMLGLSIPLRKGSREEWTSGLQRIFCMQLYLVGK